jgi:hypothetical protein
LRETLDAVIAELGDDERTVAGQLEVVGIIEFAWVSAGFSPQPNKSALVVKNLDAMIAGVGHPDASV